MRCRSLLADFLALEQRSQVGVYVLVEAPTRMLSCSSFREFLRMNSPG